MPQGLRRPAIRTGSGHRRTSPDGIRTGLGRQRPGRLAWPLASTEHRRRPVSTARIPWRPAPLFPTPPVWRLATAPLSSARSPLRSPARAPASRPASISPSTRIDLGRGRRPGTRRAPAGQVTASMSFNNPQAAAAAQTHIPPILLPGHWNRPACASPRQPELRCGWAGSRFRPSRTCATTTGPRNAFNQAANEPTLDLASALSGRGQTRAASGLDITI